MIGKVFKIFNVLIYVYVMAFEELVYGQGSQEMMENGRTQYQLLRERASLPQYGTCWKSAIDQVDEGCRTLSEDTQSDMALALTNCFLKMSGLEGVNCQADRKPNVRAICIRSMSDRAFNVYTAFYTHTQNMCWFLRSQVWHETVTENTRRVGKQLETSAAKQEEIIDSQQETLLMQEKLLHYGSSLEKILSDSVLSAEKVFAEYRETSKQHFELMSLMASSVGGLQSWLIGEVSWLDSIVFYVSASVICALFTSSVRTSSARFPILLLLSLNVVLERFLCNTLVTDSLHVDALTAQQNLHRYVWLSRYTFCVLSVTLLLTVVYFYKDYGALNNDLLVKIRDQNLTISESIDGIKRNGMFLANETVSFTKEKSPVSTRSSLDKESNSGLLSNGGNVSRASKFSFYNNLNCTVEDNVSSYVTSFSKDYDENLTLRINNVEDMQRKDVNITSGIRNGLQARRQLTSPLRDLNNVRYNLRSSSRTGTPDI